MIVPYPAGGTTDFLGRLVADRLQSGSRRHRSRSRTGRAAATRSAPNMVARSDPDGHTLLMATSTTLAINKTLYKNLRYDPVEGFHPDRAGRRRAVRADRQPADPGEDAGRIHRLRQVKAGTDLRFGRQRQPAASRRRDAEGSGRDQHPPCPVSQQRAGDARRDRGTRCLHGDGPAAGAEADPRGQGADASA